MGHPPRIGSRHGPDNFKLTMADMQWVAEHSFDLTTAPDGLAKMNAYLARHHRTYRLTAEEFATVLKRNGLLF
jgi:hypothetical protein